MRRYIEMLFFSTVCVVTLVGTFLLWYPHILPQYITFTGYGPRWYENLIFLEGVIAGQLTAWIFFLTVRK
jgi:hypothetical protein